jgi:DNA-binding MarR family transcriptional regulator
MDALNELSQEGYVQIRKISDDRHRGFHVIQLTDKGTNAANLVRPNKEIGNLIEHYSAVDTDKLTEESYKEFYRAITPTML